MELKNKTKIKFYEVPLDDGKFALMNQKEFDKYTVGSPEDAIAKAIGPIDYIKFELDGKNYAVPEHKFELYLQKLKANEI
jgi:tricorn protease-like protein